jgi:hypothetical protein
MRRHAFEPFSFVAGLLFVVLALFFLSGERTAGDLSAAWIWPVLILAPGLLLVLHALGRMTRSRGAEEPTPVEPIEPIEPPEA